MFAHSHQFGPMPGPYIAVSACYECGRMQAIRGHKLFGPLSQSAKSDSAVLSTPFLQYVDVFCAWGKWRVASRQQCRWIGILPVYQGMTGRTSVPPLLSGKPTLILAIDAGSNW